MQLIRLRTQCSLLKTEHFISQTWNIPHFTYCSHIQIQLNYHIINKESMCDTWSPSCPRVPRVLESLHHILGKWYIIGSWELSRSGVRSELCPISLIPLFQLHPLLEPPSFHLKNRDDNTNVTWTNESENSITALYWMPNLCLALYRGLGRQLQSRWARLLPPWDLLSGWGGESNMKLSAGKYVTDHRSTINGQIQQMKRKAMKRMFWS